MSRACRVGALACLALAGCDSVLRLDPITPLSPSPRAIVFDNASSDSDLTGFPVLVGLDASAVVYEQIADPSHDLRFRDEATNTDLPFEIDHWDPAGESSVWVKVPVIHAHATSERVLMYYGPDAAGSEQPAAVWSDYELVFHGDGLRDSTGKSTPMMVADTSGALPTTAPGMIGNAITFAGAENQRVQMMGSSGVLDHWPTYTIELCLAPAYMPDPPDLGTVTISGMVRAVEPSVISKPGGGFSGGRLRNSAIGAASPLDMQTDFAWESDVLQGAIFYMPDLQWSQVTFSYDGQILWWYRDGVILDVHALDKPQSSAIVTSPDDVDVGGVSGGAPLLGAIDEVRVSRAFHGVDWVFAQYLVMTRHFVTIRDP